MTLIEFAAFTLAASAIVDAWVNGEIFENGREHATADMAAFKDGQWQYFFGAARHCVYCFSYHTPWYLAPSIVVAAFTSGPWRDLAMLPIYCLAATRINFLVDGLLPATLRYARSVPAGTETVTDAGGDHWPDTQHAGTGTPTPTTNDGGGER